MKNRIIHLFAVVLFLCASYVPAQSKKALFDNTKSETAGNADWIIDTDQPVPAPPQSGILPSTSETYWLGAISAWGVDLAKLGYTVHTLTPAYGITYGNSGNPYDLSQYDLFIVCEPQGPFSSSEKTAIQSFVANGGGLFMVGDHDGSDRNGDGWDSPKVWNDLRSDSLFGIHFQSTGETNNNISQNSTNLAAGTDSIIDGPAGTASVLSFHNGSTLRLTSSNPTAAGHVWMNGALHGSSQIMLATARYGNGKVAAVPDSSPADDSTGQAGNSSLYNGWTGDNATDNIFFLNACLWLTARPPAVPPPDAVVLDQPADAAAFVPVPVVFQWHAAAGGGVVSYQIDVSPSASFSPVALRDTAVGDTFRTFSPLDLNTQYFWRVRAKNAGGWGPYSASRSLTTWYLPPAVELLEPADGGSGIPVPVLFRWSRPPAGNAPRSGPETSGALSALSLTAFRLDVSSSEDFADVMFSDSTLADTLKSLGGLSPGERVYWRVWAKNDAGWGPASATRSFVTWSAPPPVAPVAPAESARVHADPVALLWRTAPGALVYHVELALSGTFEAPFLTDSTIVDTSYAAAGLDTGVSYFWRARAGNAAGWGEFSPARSFRRTLEVTASGWVNAGWNLISLPVVPEHRTAAELFPTSVTSAFLYDGASYVMRDTLSPGTGYWLRFPGSQSVSVTGVPLSSDTMQITEGWNLVGSLASPVAALSVTSSPPGILVSPFFGYQSNYTAVDTLKPLRAYWVKASQAGTLLLHSTAAAAGLK